MRVCSLITALFVALVSEALPVEWEDPQVNSINRLPARDVALPEDPDFVRSDVKHEDFEGHQLDRDCLGLLREY